MTQKAKAEAACKAWNKKHLNGTPVIVRRDNGEEQEGLTTTAAYVLGGHTAVIHVDTISGCYALDRVRAKEAQ